MMLNYAAPAKASGWAGALAIASVACGLGVAWGVAVSVLSLLRLPEVLHTAATFWPVGCFLGMVLATLAVERRCARKGMAIVGFGLNMGMLLVFVGHLCARIVYGT